MKKEKKSKTKKIILIILGIVLGLPLLIVIGFALIIGGIILWDKFTNVPGEPEITHGEFPYELVYEYNGEEYTIKDSLVCEYEGIKYSLDDGNFRAWECNYKEHDTNGIFYIDKENNPRLFVNITLDGRYYMGEKDGIDYGKPYFELDFVPLDEVDPEEPTIEEIDIEIIEWNTPEPIKNTYK